MFARRNLYLGSYWKGTCIEPHVETQPTRDRPFHAHA
jgi:hypothetical protein